MCSDVVCYTFVQIRLRVAIKGKHSFAHLFYEQCDKKHVYICTRPFLKSAVAKGEISHNEYGCFRFNQQLNSPTTLAANGGKSLSTILNTFVELSRRSKPRPSLADITDKGKYSLLQ